MLYKVQTKFKDGRTNSELISSPTPPKFNPKQDNIISIIVQPFRYEVEHYMPLNLYVANDGLKYILPVWMEVHPDTTENDIKHIKPEIKEPKQTEVVKTEGSLGYTYKTTYDSSKGTYKCTCPGFWRSKGNCKHVKALREKNLANQDK